MNDELEIRHSVEGSSCGFPLYAFHFFLTTLILQTLNQLTISCSTCQARALFTNKTYLVFCALCLVAGVLK